MLSAILWIIIFLAALTALVKGADLLLASAEKIGLALGLSPFVVGVMIVGVGTSFPELISSIVAVLQGASEIVTANAVGSNVANIFLVVGVAAVIGRRLTVEKDLIDLDLPLLAISTVLFLGAVYDGSINRIEAALLLAAYVVYLAYTGLHSEDRKQPKKIMLPSRKTRRQKKARKRKGVSAADYAWLAVGIIALVIGAKYLVDSVVALSAIFGIATGAITIIAVAFGTSLPELLVSAKAAWNQDSEVALGGIFGSNVFNLLVVVGLPGLFGQLQVDEPTLLIGVPAMVLATLLFVISGISKRIHVWEGIMYLVAYGMFVGKIFGLF